MYDICGAVMISLRVVVDAHPAPSPSWVARAIGSREGRGRSFVWYGGVEVIELAMKYASLASHAC